VPFILPGKIASLAGYPVWAARKLPLKSISKRANRSG
jgi:hypothetical protein